MNNILATTLTHTKATSRATRIWSEGANNIKAGFIANATYTITYNTNQITLTLDDNGSRRVTDSNRAGKSRPIIDLHCKAITDIFGQNTPVSIEFSAGKIVIKGA